MVDVIAEGLGLAAIAALLIFLAVQVAKANASLEAARPSMVNKIAVGGAVVVALAMLVYAYCGGAPR